MIDITTPRIWITVRGSLRKKWAAIITIISFVMPTSMKARADIIDRENNSVSSMIIPRTDSTLKRRNVLRAKDHEESFDEESMLRGPSSMREAIRDTSDAVGRVQIIVSSDVSMLPYDFGKQDFRRRSWTKTQRRLDIIVEDWAYMYPTVSKLRSSTAVNATEDVMTSISRDSVGVIFSILRICATISVKIGEVDLTTVYKDMEDTFLFVKIARQWRAPTNLQARIREAYI